MITNENKNIDLSALTIERDNIPEEQSSWLKAHKAKVIAGAILLLGLTYFLVTPKAIKVKVSKVSSLTPVQAAAMLNASGYIVARSKAEISPKAVGRISWLSLEEGQKVKKGQLVARLESAELTAQKRQIQASLEQAKRDRDRFKSLLADQAVSKQSYENAETQVESLQAQFEYFNEQIRNTEIFAPIDGTVTVKKAYLGETVAPQGFGGSGSAGATFAVIVDMGSLEMEADISEQNLGRLKAGQAAVVVLDAYPDRPYKAKLRQIVPTADRQKGSVNVKVELLEKDDKILPEMSARVTFLSSDVDSAAAPTLFIPKTAVVTVNQQKGVMVVAGSLAKFQAVNLGEVKDTLVEVTSSISPDTQIVANASDFSSWKITQKVKVIKE